MFPFNTNPAKIELAWANFVIRGRQVLESSGHKEDTGTQSVSKSEQDGTFCCKERLTDSASLVNRRHPVPKCYANFQR